METIVPVPKLAEELGTKPETLRQYAARKDDPLPIRYFKGKERSGFVVMQEFYPWLDRNTCMYAERMDYAE